MTSYTNNIDSRCQWGWIAPGQGESDPNLRLRSVTPVQTHSANVVEVFDLSQPLPQTDGILTTVPSLTLAVRTADCVPIILYAPDINAIAAVHAGWRGSLNFIQQRAVCLMAAKGADPALIQARIGPAICGVCYQIDDTVASRFEQAGYASHIRRESTVDPLSGQLFPGWQIYLDLPAMNIDALIRAGLRSKNIVNSRICTRHTSASSQRPNLPSWRRHPGTQERLLTWVRLLPPR